MSGDLEVGASKTSPRVVASWIRKRAIGVGASMGGD
jgi:hypothetical protein